MLIRRLVPLRDERGFSMAEIAVTLGILAVLVLSMSTALASGVRYLVTSKQRAAAVQLAQAILERARAIAQVDWTQLGLVSSDVPNGDSNITSGSCAGQTANLYAGEPVVTAGSTGTNPFAPHVQTHTAGSTAVTLKIYVTGLTNTDTCSTTTHDYKRVTVLATWARKQDGVSNEVRLATFVHSADRGAQPGFEATASYTGGRIRKVSSTSSAVSTSMFLPQTSADGRDLNAQIRVYKSSGIAPMAMVDDVPATSEHKRASIADSDPTNDPVPGESECDPTSGTSTWSDFIGGLIGASVTGTADSCSYIKHAADQLPYTAGNGSLTSLVMASTVPAGGVLPTFGVTSSCPGPFSSSSIVDGSGSGATMQNTMASATTGGPSCSLLTFGVGSINPTDGVVHLGAGSYSASAKAGLAAVASDTSVGGLVTFKIYDPNNVIAGCMFHDSNYCRMTIDTAAAGFNGYERTYIVPLSVFSILGVETARITLTSSVVIPAPKMETTSTMTGSISFAKATAPLPRIDTTMVIQSPVGVTLATITDSVDLGQLVSIARYLG